MRAAIAKTARPAELRACARLMAGSEPWLTLGRKYPACLKSLRGPGREVYALRENGAPAGFIVLQMLGVLKGYVQTVCVAPEFRGRGCGQLLLEFAERRVFSETPNIFLCVSSFNRRAQVFYRRLGYRRAGTLKNFVVSGHDELLLRKTTGPLDGFCARARRAGGRL
ncbi:MAG: N-acetyltransferase [Elusimicrobiales bacterium]